MKRLLQKISILCKIFLVSWVLLQGSMTASTAQTANPVHTGSITNGTGGALLGGARSVYVSGNYAYVASSSSNTLEIVDVSNPAAPMHKGSITDGHGGALLHVPYSVYVSGNYAYVASYGSNALEIVDVSNPSFPTHKGNITHGTGGALLNGPQSVYVSGNYAYVVSHNTLEIVDVINPAAPIHKGSFIINLNLKSIYVSGNYAYIANSNGNALAMVNVSSPIFPDTGGSITNGTDGALLQSPQSIYVSDKYAYVASSGSSALEIIDVSIHGAPMHTGSISNGTGGALLSGACSVFVSGNFAYLASQFSNALEIVDISNPAAPTHGGSIVNGTGGALLNSPRSVYVSGNYAYVASYGSNALEIIGLVPSPPVIVSASAIAQTSFQANWNTAATADNYYLDVSASGTFSSFVTGYNNLSVGNVTNYSVNTNLSSSTTYYYRVRAANSAGPSGNSNSIGVLTLPTTPVAVAATAVTQTGFTANWNMVMGASNYFIDVAADVSFSSILSGYNNLSVATNALTVTGLSAGTTYYYRVRAANSSGSSPSSNAVSQITVPANPVASNATSITEISFKANWAASIGANNYYLDVSASSTFASFVTGYNNLPVGNVTNYTVNTNLSANNTYYYRVHAANSAGPSGNSSSMGALTLPVAPIAVAATAIRQINFVANWNSINGTNVVTFEVDVSTDLVFSTFIKNLTGINVASIIIDALSANTTYYYRVRAVNASGVSANSNVIEAITTRNSVITSLFTIMPSPDKETLLTVAPNPVENSANITIVVKEKSMLQLNVLDLTGKVVKTIKEGEVVQGLHNFEWLGDDEMKRRMPAGMYLVQLNTGKKREVKKVVLK